ncbi:hypothetical protein V6N13_015180 [Hibiscus sabdariffa]
MASPKFPAFLFLSSLFLHASLGMKNLRVPFLFYDFMKHRRGKRCLVETAVGKDGKVEHQCRTSEVVVERMAEYIETDECVGACGADRNSIGISSDALLDSQFTAKLCSPACYQKCPNIVDLYFNLAAGEGVFLPDLCNAQRSNPRRSMVELIASSGAAPGPVSSQATASFTVQAPAPAPMW